MFRLVFWVGVFAWAIWKIQDFSMQQVAVPDFLGLPLVAAGPVVLPLGDPPPGAAGPAADAAGAAGTAQADAAGAAGTAQADAAGASGTAQADAAGAVLDPAAAVAAMDAAVAVAARCGAAGELTVTLGPAGPAAATLDAKGAALDPTAPACVAAAVRAQAWPRSSLAFELTGTIRPDGQTPE
jgi:hypothetical protein